MKDNLTNQREETHMADPPPYPGAPRWVKVFGIILIVVLVLLFLIQHLVFEGMGSHMP